MLKYAASLTVIATLVAAVTPVFAADTPELKKWKECAAKVRKDYPVPPGNINALNQLIKEQCGDRPSK